MLARGLSSVSSHAQWCSGSGSDVLGRWVDHGALAPKRSAYHTAVLAFSHPPDGSTPLQFSRCDLPTERDASLFQHASGCRLASPIEAARELQTTSITFVGDSVSSYQLWSGYMWARRDQGVVVSRPGAPGCAVSIEWFCLPDSNDDLAELFRGAGLWTPAVSHQDHPHG